MKLKDLRNNLTEVASKKSQLSSHMQNISRLVRRGLLPANVLPKLRTALQRADKVDDDAKLPKEQRMLLQKYYSTLQNAALGSSRSMLAVQQNISAGYEIDGEEFLGEASNMQDPPIMMVLKRKGIRIFPDGKRVALYVNEKLGLTFTIPYSGQGLQNPMVGVTEETVAENIEHLKDMAAEGKSKELKFLDGSSIEVHHELAKKILMVHDKLDNENKAKLANMLTSSKNKFLKVANFAHEKIKPAVPNAR